MPTLPFEHNLRFELEGRPGAHHRKIINVGAGAAFVAESLSYFVDLFGTDPPSEFPASMFARGLSFVASAAIPVCCHFGAETARFKLALVDSGSGRELQNEMILNTAYVGGAGSDTPRRLGQPLRFDERTTVRVEVEEIFSARDPRLVASEDGQPGSCLPLLFNLVDGSNGMEITTLNVKAVLHIAFHGYKEVA